MAGLGCSSSTQLDGMVAQLADIQQQVLQIQKQGSSKEQITRLQAELEAQKAVLLKSQADVRVELQSLSALVEQLEAKLDDTNFRLTQLSQQIAATNQELKAVRSAPDLGPGTRSPSEAAPLDPETLYQTAYNDYLRGSYDLAILGFRQYLDSFPDTDLADNAIYWIGECYYRQRRFNDSIREFDTVVDRYPSSDKLASAFLRKGYAYLELGEQANGVVQLQHVIREYPGSDEANLARQQLTSLGLDPQDTGD